MDRMLRSVLLRALSGLLLAATGCSNSTAPHGADPEQAVALEPEGDFSLSLGPIVVPPGVEKTQCVTKRLGNSAPMKVGSIHNLLIGASHHLIVYRVEDADERLEPYDCEPFADTLSGKNGAPLMITQKHEELLELPKGLGFELAASQMIRLEMHYINPSEKAATIESHSTFHSLAAGQFEHAVGFLFAGTVDVSLPAHKSTQIQAFVEVPLELYDKHFFGFTGHTHALGTNVLVEMGDRTGPMRPVYQVDDFSWSEPPTIRHEPALTMPSDGRFRITCDYVNDLDRTVGFGESAHDEMCFFWGYYYPSAGSHVCFHTSRGGLDINSCCPGGLFCR